MVTEKKCLRLVRPSLSDAGRIEDYRAEFPSDRERVTLDPKRIPGMDYLEQFDDVRDWLAFGESLRDKITWFMSVRESDGRLVGFACLRSRLEYDDDDEEFASHIGYSIRPSERRRGYAVEQLRLVLKEAASLGIQKARIVCRETNLASQRTILACGGAAIEPVYGEESGLWVCRYDVPTAGEERG